MSEWEYKKLQNLCDVRDGTHDSPKYYETGVPFITSKNLTANGIDFNNVSYISVENHKSFSIRSKVERGDILFGMIGTIGKPVIVNVDFEFSIKNVALLKFGHSNKELMNEFAIQVLNSNIIEEQFRNKSDGGVQSFISLSTIRNLDIPVPPISQQQKIARILSTVDAVIEKTEAAIAKYKAIKAGMMHDLFTRGINENGQLRPSYQQAPHLYKPSKLGWIPKEWEIDILANILIDNNCPSGIYKERSLYGYGMNILKISEVFKYDIYRGEEIQRVPINNHEYGLNKIVQGDILMAIASVKLEGVGKAMFVERILEPTCFDHNVALLRTNEFNNSLFLFYFLKSEIIRKNISQNCTQVGTIFLKSSSIKNFKIPIIPLNEQIEIGTRLKTIDSKIQTEQTTLNKHQKLKQGLMQDLLTGIVTVSV